MLATIPLVAQEPATGQVAVNLQSISIASSSEPISAQFSPRRAVDFLDRTAVDWTRKNNCGTCHTNYAYLMAKPITLVKGAADPAMDEVRSFFENRVRHWDDQKKGAAPRWDAEVVATASALAINDRLTTGRLHDLTRKALDRMWTIQQPNGSWNWLKAKLPPYEYDDYYGAIVAALGVGYAPDDYARGESARDGVDALRNYFRKNPAPNLHHQTMLLWASSRLDGLMTAEEKNQTIHHIRKLQRADGGWCLPSLGQWKRRDGTSNLPDSPSDGYATGLLLFVMRQAGVPSTDPSIAKGINWLKTNQRVSGRWYTRSLNQDGKHYISNAGSAFAIMALDSCGAIDSRILSESH
jgi:squalene-hopene/tetraprenyl-beta-curcumene cyclase